MSEGLRGFCEEIVEGPAPQLIVEMPVIQTLKEIVEGVSLGSQERVQRRIIGQIGAVQAPLHLEDVVDALRLMPREQKCGKICEQIMNVLVS